MAQEIVAYYRVSTKIQGFDGLGMEAQRRSVESFAAARGMRIAAAYEEVETARRDHLRNRPQLVRAVAHARRSRAMLVIARLDRLARSVFVTAQLLEAGVEFVACDNPHANRMTIQILAVMAEHESRMCSERVKAAMAAAKARGVIFRCPGPISPEAMRKGQLASAESRRLITKAAYADLVPDLRAWREAGMTTIMIADHLNSTGQKNQFGDSWKRGAILGILRREGLSHIKVPRVYENHLTGTIQLMGVKAAALRRKEQMQERHAAALPIVEPMHKAGMSAIAISRELTARGLPSPMRSRWSGGVVLDTLRSVGLIPPKEPGFCALTPEVQAAGRKAAVAKKRAMAIEYYKMILPTILRLQAEDLSLGQIAAKLNEVGLLPPRAPRWTSDRLYAMYNRWVKSKIKESAGVSTLA